MPETTKFANKVIFGGRVLIDLTADTVTKQNLLANVKAHDKTGALITGECPFDMDTSGFTATASEILEGKTAGVTGNEVVGTMKNRAGMKGVIVDANIPYAILNGFHDGSGSVNIAPEEKAKLIPTNIRQGITILGVEGTMSGTEDVVAQTIEVTPSTTAQTIVPGEGYNYLAQVNVKAIPYTEVENAVGGLTVTIG